MRDRITNNLEKYLKENFDFYYSKLTDSELQGFKYFIDEYGLEDLKGDDSINFKNAIMYRYFLGEIKRMSENCKELESIRLALKFFRKNF